MQHNIIFEHQWRRLTVDPAHKSLWSPPVFFPQTHTAAYTDLLLGVSPAYDLWRLAEADPQFAFQLGMLAMSAFKTISQCIWCSARMANTAANDKIPNAPGDGSKLKIRVRLGRPDRADHTPAPYPETQSEATSRAAKIDFSRKEPHRYKRNVADEVKRATRLTRRQRAAF